MTDIDPGLFKRYDIRGRAAGEGAVLTPPVARAIGQAIGTYLIRFEQMRQVIVGRDNRLTSRELQQAVMQGLAAAGCRVVDIDLVSTPIVYWQAAMRHIAGVMVTGSHLPPVYNGLKLCAAERSLHSDVITTVGRLAQEADFEQGAGEILPEPDAWRGYVRDLRRRIQPRAALRVIVDTGNGTAGLFAPVLLEAWGQRTTGLYLELDGTYPNHIPDPMHEAHIRELSAQVVARGADLGIAFDGDADRVGFLDERGRLVAADRVLALLARDALARHPGEVVVGDVMCSQVLVDVVTQAGGRFHMAPTGHALVKDAMRETGALIGGEMSGHLFLAEDYPGFDDGYFAAGRMLELLSRAGRPLSALDDELPRMVSTPAYRPHCPEEHKAQVIQAVTEALRPHGTVIDVDGVRLVIDRAWGILRASNTEPALTLRFEGQTEGDVARIRRLFEEQLRRFPFVGPLQAHA